MLGCAAAAARLEPRPPRISSDRPPLCPRSRHSLFGPLDEQAATPSQMIIYPVHGAPAPVNATADQPNVKILPTPAHLNQLSIARRITRRHVLDRLRAARGGPPARATQWRGPGRPPHPLARIDGGVGWGFDDARSLARLLTNS